MPTLYSADTITVGGGDPAAVEGLNDVLWAAGLGRPLGPLSRVAGERLVVQVGGVDPGSVRMALRAAGAGDGVRLDPVYLSGTSRLAGPGIGEAFAWSEFAVTDQPHPPPWQAPPTGLRRPVVALLDSGVRDHPWLPVTMPDDPFVLHSDDSALARWWESPLAETKTHDGQSGHATFMAGLIRAAAPSARVLSVRVMTDDGKVLESTVVDALHWLEGHRAAGYPVDVLCLPFGRHAGDPESLEDIGKPLWRLAGAGVAIVAPAGNDHRDEPVYPAAFPGVTAVGAGFGDYHASFSNYGEWVGRYRDGVEVLGILPPDRWARWTGTSFAAAAFAADLARPQVV